MIARALFTDMRKDITATGHRLIFKAGRLVSEHTLWGRVKLAVLHGGYPAASSFPC